MKIMVLYINIDKVVIFIDNGGENGKKINKCR